MMGKKFNYLSQKNKSFSLVEAVVALVILSLGMTIIVGTTQIISQQVHANSSDDRFELERLVSFLQADRMQFELVSSSKSELTPELYSLVSKKHYRLYYAAKKSEVIMTTVENNGYMILLYGVDDFELSNIGNKLHLSCTLHHKKYELDFLLPLWKEKR